MTDPGKYRRLFESYNTAISKKFEESMHMVQSPGDYSRLMADARMEWEKDLFEGRTPVEIFSDIEGGELKDIFIDAALLCDDFIPESLADRIVGYGNMEEIAGLAVNDGEIEIRTAAIGLLGHSGDESYTDMLMKLFYSEGEDADLLAESARKAIVGIGSGCIPHIKRMSEGIKFFSGGDFHMLMALIEIDGGRKSDEIYSILKRGFRNTGEKALAARCLSDFGDGRAVTMLRGFLERNIKTMDEGDILEIQGAIMKLGGSAEGIG